MSLETINTSAHYSYSKSKLQNDIQKVQEIMHFSLATSISLNIWDPNEQYRLKCLFVSLIFGILPINSTLIHTHGKYFNPKLPIFLHSHTITILLTVETICFNKINKNRWRPS